MKYRSTGYYVILWCVWALAFIGIFVVSLRLVGVAFDWPRSESLPVWLGILYLIIAVVGALVVAVLVANRIAAKFMSKEAMIEIINKNFDSSSPFYGLIVRDIEKIYQKKDV